MCFPSQFLSLQAVLDLPLLPSLTELLKKHIITHAIVSLLGSPDINQRTICISSFVFTIEVRPKIHP